MLLNSDPLKVVEVSEAVGFHHVYVQLGFPVALIHAGTRLQLGYDYALQIYRNFQECRCVDVYDGSFASAYCIGDVDWMGTTPAIGLRLSLRLAYSCACHPRDMVYTLGMRDGASGFRLDYVLAAPDPLLDVVRQKRCAMVQKVLLDCYGSRLCDPLPSPVQLELFPHWSQSLFKK